MKCSVGMYCMFADNSWVNSGLVHSITVHYLNHCHWVHVHVRHSLVIQQGGGNPETTANICPPFSSLSFLLASTADASRSRTFRPISLFSHSSTEHFTYYEPQISVFYVVSKRQMPYFVALKLCIVGSGGRNIGSLFFFPSLFA